VGEGGEKGGKEKEDGWGGAISDKGWRGGGVRGGGKMVERKEGDGGKSGGEEE